ncbi:MAG: hypothetical protein ABH859_06830 [Pseudomonadota bacterium]
MLITANCLAFELGEKKVFIVSPIAGPIYHKLPAMGRMPSQADWGPNFGLFSALLAKNMNWIAFPYYATANNAEVWGVVTHYDYYLPVSDFIQPVFGAGFDVTKIDVKNSSMGDTLVIAPWPKVGVRFKISDNLHLIPYTAYLYQYIDTAGASRNYQSALFGLQIQYHFNHFLMAKLKYYYRYTYNGRDGHDVKLRVHLLANKNFGLTARFQYSKQIFDEFVSILVGPAIIF